MQPLPHKFTNKACCFTLFSISVLLLLCTPVAEAVAVTSGNLNLRVDQLHLDSIATKPSPLYDPVLKWAQMVNQENLLQNLHSNSLSEYYNKVAIEDREALFAYLSIIYETELVNKKELRQQLQTKLIPKIQDSLDAVKLSENLLNLASYPVNSEVFGTIPGHYLAVMVYSMIAAQNINQYLNTEEVTILFERLNNRYKQLSEQLVLLERGQSRTSVQNKQRIQLERDLILSSDLWHQYNKGDYPTLIQRYNAHGPFYELPNTTSKARILLAISYAQFSSGLYSEVLKTLENGLIPLIETLPKELLEVQRLHFQSINLYGVCLNQIGKHEEAENTLTALLHPKLNDQQQSQLLNNLGLAYLNQGKQNEYVAIMNNAYELAQRNNNAQDMLIISQNLFLQNIQTGNTLAAKDYLNRAETIAVSIGTKKEKADIAYLKAVQSWDYELNKTRSIGLLNTAINLLNPDVDFFDWARLATKKAEIYKESKEYKKAIDTLKRIQSIAREQQDAQLFTQSTVLLTEIYLDSEQYSQIPLLLDELEPFNSQQLRFGQFIRYESLRNEWAYRQGFTDLAIQRMEELVGEIVTRVQLSSNPSSGFWFQVEAYNRAFLVMYTMYKNQKRDFEAVALLDQIKTLNQVSLGIQDRKIIESLKDQEAAREQYLREITQNLRSQYIQESDPVKRTLIQSNIEQFTSERSQLLRSVRNQSRTTPLSPNDVRELQKKLAYNTQVLHLTEVEGQLILISLTRHRIKQKIIPMPPDTVRFVTQTIDQLQSGQTNVQHLYRIYELLGLDDAIDSKTKQLVVIQDPLLFALPFDVLPTSKPSSPTSYGSTSYLIEQLVIEQYPSLNYYKRVLSKRQPLFRSAQTSFVGFGIADFSDYASQETRDGRSSSTMETYRSAQSLYPYLKNAPIEISSAAQMLQSHIPTQLYLNEQATKAQFKKTAAQAAILHVASHSVVNQANPLFSRILFSVPPYHSNEFGIPNTISQSSLYAYELFDLNLRPKIALFNACSSGSGNRMKGSGMLGFSRALLYAGTHGMLMNAWAITDAHALRLSNLFYREMSDGGVTTTAIHNAKLALLYSDNANPHYWGAFQYIGEPLRLKTTPLSAIYMFSLIFFLVGWGGNHLRAKFVVKRP